MVPVIDIQANRVVHAVAGPREGYATLQSSLLSSHDPIAVARAFRDRLHLREIYVADLDAIEGGQLQGETIEALASEVDVVIDAGASDAARIRTLVELGAARVVIGTETVDDVAALARTRSEVAAVPLTLSLDVRDTRVLSADTQLAASGPIEALERLEPLGFDEVVVLDLARVGTGRGPNLELIGRVAARFPALDVVAGGGIRDLADLAALQAAGAAGALVATALHNLAIGVDELD